MKDIRNKKIIVIEALKSNYGFAPNQTEVEILEANDDRTRIQFKVKGHEYNFKSTKMFDGSVWVGYGTIDRKY